MTADDILARDAEDTIWFTGAELQDFCDFLERESPHPMIATLRESPRILGKRVPITWLDETNRIVIGSFLNREWQADIPTTDRS